jgi:tryptophan-rich sensory protein
MKNKKLLVMGISLVFMIVMNFLAVGLPLNGLSTAEISDSFKVYFVPAGYVFSIWGVIYVTQAWAYYKLFSEQKKYKALIEKISIWFIIGNLANGLWLVFWHYEQIFLTLPLMLLLLISLIVMYLSIKKYYPTVKSLTIPFGIYLGWITVATVANVTDVFYALKWDGFGLAGEYWSGILIIIASVLGFMMIKLQREYAYIAVIIWSIVGIGVKFSGNYNILLAVLVGIALQLLSLLDIIDDKKKKIKKLKQ